MLAYLISCIALFGSQHRLKVISYLNVLTFPLYVTFVVIALFACSQSVPKNQKVVMHDSLIKIKGISYVSPPNELKKVQIDPLNDISANYLAVMPFAHMPEKDKPGLRFEYKHQWWGEGPKGVREMIDSLKQREFKIMLKPQIWISRGVFTGVLEMSTTNEWEELEVNYLNYILKYAEIAQESKVEIFCIGTELGRWVKQRPEYWQKLIREVRNLYKGKITYAENWDCFDQAPFLKDLDFIGVDAYFPLTDKVNPSKEELVTGWKSHLHRMKLCADSIGLPVLLTEVGYRNVVGAGIKPWDYSDRNAERDDDLQALLYEVLFQEVYSQDFIAGGFIWKWFPLHDSLNKDSRGFTPQHKPAQKVLGKWYKKL